MPISSGSSITEQTVDIGAVAADSYGRIMMTGGTGFVGGYLARLIAQSSHAAERLMISRSQPKSDIPSWAWVIAEIDNHDGIDRVAGGFRPDLVIHMAAQASAGVANSSMKETWSTNFGGTFSIANESPRVF
jgi:GDP-4-dehydro-6-deoxy-D-mannose reductase